MVAVLDKKIKYMNIKVAQNWSELTDKQQQEIAYLYLTATEDNFNERFLQMVYILFHGSNNIFKTYRLFKQVPISKLILYGKFLTGIPDLFSFPEVNHLRKPGDRLNDITIQQFSVADTLFFKWRDTGEEIYLRQLCAALYRLGDFDKLKLPNVATITDNISINKMYQIGMVYLSVRNYITNKFPKIFPKPKSNTDNEQLKTVKAKYTPFSKVITAMAMDERQPLGTLKECSTTLIYDFFPTLEESIVRTENLEKQLKS